MNAQLKMFVWKEWRERQWQFALCSAFILAPGLWLAVQTIRPLVMPTAPAMYLELPLAWLGLYALVMPLLVAMRTACGEATERTGAFSLALPASPGRSRWLRLASGAVVLAAPVLLLGVAATLWMAVVWYIDPKVASQLLGGYSAIEFVAARLWLGCVVVAASAVCCYLQLALLGTFVRTENQLAFLGGVWTVAWLLAAAVLPGPNRDPNSIEWISPHTLLLSVLAVEPFGADAAHAAQFGSELLTNLVLAGALAFWFVHRHSRSLTDSTAEFDWTRIQRLLPRVLFNRRPWIGSYLPKSRLAAIAWLSLRQALPMCLAGLAIGLLLSLMVLSVETARMQVDGLWTEATRIFVFIIAIVGILWASIVGVGSVADELDRHTGDFWRTRPIPYWWLFTIKFLVGLAAVTIVLDGAALVASRLAPAKGSSMSWDWAYLACMLPLHATMFAVAVALACWMRRVAVGAMAAVVAWAAYQAVSEMDATLRYYNPISIYERFTGNGQRTGQALDLTTNGYPIMIVTLALTIVLCFTVAGFALARYQPRQRLD